MKFNERLVAARKALGISQKELAQKIDIKQGRLSLYETGKREPDVFTLGKLADALDVCADWLIGLTDNPHKTYGKTNTASLFSSEAVKIARQYDQLDSWGRSAVEAIIREETARCTAPASAAQEEKVITLNFNELKASAGTGWELMDEHMTPWTVKLNDLTRKADFCLAVEGDSMEPKFQDGDLILIRRQPAIEEGQFGLYTFDNHGYVKQQGCGKLHSLNPAYPDIFPGEYADIECKGLVLGKLEPEWIVSR